MDKVISDDIVSGPTGHTNYMFPLVQATWPTYLTKQFEYLVSASFNRAFTHQIYLVYNCNVTLYAQQGYVIVIPWAQVLCLRCMHLPEGHKPKGKCVYIK